MASNYPTLGESVLRHIGLCNPEWLLKRARWRLGSVISLITPKKANSALGLKTHYARFIPSATTRGLFQLLTNLIIWFGIHSQGQPRTLPSSWANCIFSPMELQAVGWVLDPQRLNCKSPSAWLPHSSAHAYMSSYVELPAEKEQSRKKQKKMPTQIPLALGGIAKN